MRTKPEPVDPVTLARDLMRHTLHGSPPIATTMLIAEALVKTDADLAALRIEHEAHAALLDAARGDRDEARSRLRHVAQMLIEVVGAGGPMDAEAAAEKAVAAIMERDALRAQVADLTRLGASIHKAADAARKAERADVLAYVAHIGQVYLGKHGGGGDYCAALGEFRNGVEAGAHEGAAEVKHG